MSNLPPLDRATIQKIADTIRILSLEAIQKANSGHPVSHGLRRTGAMLYARHLR